MTNHQQSKWSRGPDLGLDWAFEKAQFRVGFGCFVVCRTLTLERGPKCHFCHLFCAVASWRKELIRTGNLISCAIHAEYSSLYEESTASICYKKPLAIPI